MTFLNLQDIPARELIPGFNGRFVHSDGITVAHWEIEAGSELPSHTHPQEMIINLLEGEFELTVDDETRVLRAGAVVVIPGDVPHAGRASPPAAFSTSGILPATTIVSGPIS